MKKILLALALALLAMSALFATGSDEKTAESEIATSLSGPVEIEFWHAMSSKLGQTVQSLADNFNATIGKEMGITVTPLYQGSYNDLKQKITAAIKAGIAPSVAQAYPDWVAEYMQADVVVDLDDYINDSKVGMSDFNDIFPGYRDENSQYSDDGTFYSLPFNKSTEVIFYNKTFFEKNNLSVPKTWSDVEAVSKKIMELTGKPGFGYDSLANYMITMIRQFGGKYTDSKGNIYFNQGDAAVKAIELYKRNFDAGFWRIAGEDMYMSGPFNNQDCYMYVGSTAGAAYVGSDLFTWDSAVLPYIDANKKAAIQQGTNIFLMDQDKDPEEVYAAYVFAKYLVSKESNFIWATNTGYLPIRQSVVDSQEYKDYLKTTKDTTKTTGPAQGSYYFYDPGFYSPDYTSSDARTAIQGALEDALLNGTAPAAAIKAAYDKLK